MTRRVSAMLAGLLLAAVCQVWSGEEPAPGLEVFDSGYGFDSPPAPETEYPVDAFAAPPSGQPEYAPFSAPDAGPAGDPFSDPFAAPVSEPVSTEPDPALTEAAPPIEPPPPESMYPPNPVEAALADLNIGNPNFPGLREAAASGSLLTPGAIVWEVLKARRVIASTMERGPGGSAGAANPGDLQRVAAAANFSAPDPSGLDSPLMAARRVDAIMDAFERPEVADHGFGGMMPAILARLHSDLYAVRGALAGETDENAYLEMAGAYLRAAAGCDFFVFPNAVTAADVDAVMNRAGQFFYPDGASIAGDVAGVTAGLFETALAMDSYTRDDSRFRARLGGMWRGLETPVRHVLDLALPDGSLPLFGPRGRRELDSAELLRLDSLFPKRAPRRQRIGLAASGSFPGSSDAASYDGIFVTRSGPEADARYLAVRFGPPSVMTGAPSHLDFGSIALMSRNVRYIIDGGGFDSPAALPPAHSVLSLDGRFVELNSYAAPGQPVNALWRTNAGLDFAAGRAAFADGKTWQRSVVYVKDLPGESLTDYWLVLDDVDMKGDPRPLRARIRYQFAPGVQAYDDGAGIVASAGFMDGSSLRIFAIDANAELTVSEGEMGLEPSYVYDPSGGGQAAPAVTLGRTLVGNSTTATVLFPAAAMNHRPVRLERDADVIRGRTGAVIVDHGNGRIDVVAWAPPGTELVTPTLNLQMSADLAVFRLRNNKFVRINFINLERFQAKEPDGGVWSMRVDGPAQTLTLEPESGGGWQVLSDPANEAGAVIHGVNFGPGNDGRRFSVRPGELRIVPRR